MRKAHGAGVMEVRELGRWDPEERELSGHVTLCHLT